MDVKMQKAIDFVKKWDTKLQNDMNDPFKSQKFH